MYSTNHTTLKPFGSKADQNKYWYFTCHQIGFYDLPASIDYALATTEQEKLHFIGHSQGAAVFFVMTSERPEYNDKIEMMHALGPVAFFHADRLSIRGLTTAFMPMLTVDNLLLLFFSNFHDSNFHVLICSKQVVWCDSITFHQRSKAKVPTNMNRFLKI